MRWDRLFDDLECQADAADRDELRAEVADRTRRELALVRVEDRLRAATGARVGLRLFGGHELRGTVGAAGAGWMWLDVPTGRALVATAALCELDGLGTAVAPPSPEVDARIGLTHVLRALAQDRWHCVVGLTDGRQLRGTPGPVGRDFIDLTDRADDPSGRVTVGRTVLLRSLAFCAGPA